MTGPHLIHPSKEILLSYNQCQLDETTNAEINKHLSNCDECSDFVAKISDTHRTAETPHCPSESDKSSSSTELSQQPQNKNTDNAALATTQVPPADVHIHPDYMVIRELGRGGMGVVYLTRNILMNRLEALKIINENRIASQTTADRFLREIQTVAKLNHPNVVSAYNAFRVNNRLILTMEYVPGQNLEELVSAQRTFSIRKACYFIIQAASGLQHAYELGLVHRDIKPSNLMCYKNRRKWCLKILDFGLAKFVDDDENAQSPDQSTITQDGAIIGTPAYISPEQISGGQNADIRSDIYSLGCTFYFLLTGQPPFRGESKYELILAHHQDTPLPLTKYRQDIPEPLSAIVFKMMEKNPEDRFQEPVEIIQALKEGVIPFIPQFPEDKVSQIDSTSPASNHPELKPDALNSTSRSRRNILKTHYLSALFNSSRGRIGRFLLLILALLAGFGAFGIFHIKTPHGTLILENVPEDANVFIDNEKVTLISKGDDIPIEITIPPGQHGVTVKKAGFQTFGKKVQIINNDRIELSVSLAPLPLPKLSSDNAQQNKFSNQQSPLFPSGTQWTGKRSYVQGGYAGTTVSYFLHIDKSDGKKFAGVVYDRGPRRNKALVEGSIHGTNLSWTERPLHMPGTELKMSGILEDNLLTVTFTGEYANKVKTAGNGELRRQEADLTSSISETIDKEWNNLLTEVKLPDQVFKGNWSHSGNILTADARNTTHAALNLNMNGNSYEFQTEFVIKQHKKYPGVVMSLPVGDSRTQISLWTPDWVQMRHVKDKGIVINKDSHYSEKNKHLGFNTFANNLKIDIKDNEKCVFNISVMEEAPNYSITVTINHSTVFKWKGSPDEVWEPQHDLNLWENRNQQGIVIACERDCVVDFHSALFRNNGIPDHKPPVKNLISDPFVANSVWTGIGYPPKKEPVNLRLRVVERSGEFFKATLNIGNETVNEIKGTVIDGTVKWSSDDVRSINGPKRGASNTGVISKSNDGHKIVFRFKGKKGNTGTYELHLN